MHIVIDTQAQQERYSRPLGGVDHGSTGKILAEVQKDGKMIRRLVWFKGGKRATCGVRGFGQTTFPTRLQVIEGNGFGFSDITEGGRLSQQRIQDHASAIDKAMGCKVADKIDLAKTLYAIIGDKT